jgi:hypothetical protein
MRLLPIVGAVVALSSCGTDQYAPCDGSSGSCNEARAVGGEVNACVCTYYCEADSDCPQPETGNAPARCQPFGDVVVNGESASCILPCDASTTCPDEMFCHQGECMAPR